MSLFSDLDVAICTKSDFSCIKAYINYNWTNIIYLKLAQRNIKTKKGFKYSGKIDDVDGDITWEILETTVASFLSISSKNLHYTFP